jgi:hypothetical protein
MRISDCGLMNGKDNAFPYAFINPQSEIPNPHSASLYQAGVEIFFAVVFQL